MQQLGLAKSSCDGDYVFENKHGNLEHFLGKRVFFLI